MTSQITRHATWLARLLVGLYIVFITAGLALQTMAASFLLNPWFEYLTSLAFLVWALLGSLLIIRQPGHPVGWLFCLLALEWTTDNLAYGYAYYGLIFNPGSIPSADTAALWFNWGGQVIFAAIISWLLLLFPTGRSLSRGWARVGVLATVSGLVYLLISAIVPSPIYDFPIRKGLFPIGEQAQGFLGTIALVAVGIEFLCMVAAVVSLFVRLRKARGVERQQLKWFVYAAAFFPIGLAMMIPSLFFPAAAPDYLFLLGQVILAVFLFGLPIASTIAILRYHLYEIDKIINRTLVYGLLTAALAIIYFLTVLLVQFLFQGVSGQQSPLVIVFSTLLIAVLFSPLRRRIQNFIDQRFFRRKYDAAETMAKFAASARDEVDLNQLILELERVVNDTIQPESVSLWLKER